MPRSTRPALAAAAALTLALGGALLGSTVAYAGDPADACDFESDLQFSTAGAHWLYVCDHDGEIGEASTPHKNDGIDGLGYIQLDDGTTLPINAPEGEGTVTSAGAEITITYTDVDVDSGGGDLVDIVVVRTFEGSFVSWQVSVFDADDSSPRADVPLALTGNLGSDSATITVPLGQSQVTYGDPSDPVIAWQITGANGAFVPAGGPDGIRVEFENAVTTLTVGFIDYGCTPAAMEAAADYAETIAPTLSAVFGQSLVAPGSTFCSTAPAELYLAPGQPFDIVVPVTYTSAFDFGPEGADIYDWETPDWVTVEELGTNDPGVIPTLRLTGTAPESGSWLFSFDTVIYDGDDSYTTAAGNWVTLIAGTAPPQLAATGVSATPAPWIAAGGVLVLGVGALVTAKALRRKAQ